MTDGVTDGFSYSLCLSAEILFVHAPHSESVPFHAGAEMLRWGPADRTLYPSPPLLKTAVWNSVPKRPEYHLYLSEC